MNRQMIQIAQQVMKNGSTLPQAPTKAKIDLNRAAAWTLMQGFDMKVPENFKALVLYIAARKAGIAKKGLLLMGAIGNGKTRAAQTIAKAFGYDFRHSKWYVRTQRRAPEECEEYIYGPRDYDNYRFDLVIDDLGSEPLLNDYGTKYEFMEHVIDIRNSLFESRGWHTILTTNLDLDDIEQRYGARTRSRLLGMCNVITFRGGDRRIQKNESYLRG